MTREELESIVGDPYGADVVVKWMLGYVKPEFMLMVVRSKLQEAERLLAEREQSGYYEEFSAIEHERYENRIEYDSPGAVQWRRNYARKLERTRDQMTVDSVRKMYEKIVSELNALQKRRND